MGLGLLVITGVHALGKSPVCGGQTKGTDMLPLLVFVVIEVSVSIEHYACLGAWYGRGIVDLCHADTLLSSPRQGCSGCAFALHSGMLD